MSVVVGKRNKSPIQFIDDGRKMINIICDRMQTFLNRVNRDYKSCRKVAKKVYNYLYELPIKSATEALWNLKMGNCIKIVDEVSYNKRKHYFKAALQWYQKVSLSYSILYDNFWKKKFIKYTTVVTISNLIDEQIQRVKNVMKHDLIVYNNIGVKTP